MIFQKQPHQYPERFTYRIFVQNLNKNTGLSFGFCPAYNNTDFTRIVDMRYTGTAGFAHQQQDKIGILLVNLGTPDAPTSTALRRYLAEFLWDPRVVEIPRPLWWLILNGFILPFRPKRSAAAYAKVWTESGSPLLQDTLALRDKLACQLGDNTLIEVGMRYGNPSLRSALDRLCQQGARKLLVLPLYPQYSGATSGSTFDALAKNLCRQRWIPELRFITHYHDFEPYIESCCQAIQNHWLSHGRPEKLVLSYHGVPKRYLDAGDPYFCECHKTSRLIAQKLELGEGDYITTFQSRFGKAEWLKPYTDATLKSFPAAGIKDVQVVCPGFPIDCLETLEEIDDENRNYFMDAGGESFSYIPALNASDLHINALKQLIETNLQGWQSAEADDGLRANLAKQRGATI